jgi:hypothetical protein
MGAPQTMLEAGLVPALLNATTLKYRRNAPPETTST